MKKKMKRLFAFLLASMMMFSTLSLTASASEDGYLMYLGYGGNSDWGFQYNAPDSADNAGDITATTAVVNPGETVTIGLEFASAPDCTWWMAPVLVAENVTNVDYTIDSILIDGTDVLADVDLTAGDAWWYEGTGTYSVEQSIRLAGGYNEWGTKYMAEGPSGFTTIEYVITVNEISTGAAEEVAEATEVTETAGEVPTDMFMFLSFGGDKESDNDWGYGYYGTDVDGVTATTAVANVGDTVTIGLTFDTPALYTWFTAPVLVAEGVTALDYTIESVTIDGVDVTADLDLTVGDDEWWYEGTGDYGSDQSIRLKGGYNEWATQAMSSSPSNFSEIMYTITINDAVVGGASADVTLSTESYQAFIAIGADKDSSNDWAYNYAGEGTPDGITVVSGELKSGETTTLSLTFDTPVYYTWYVAPCFVVDDSSLISESSTFEVKVYLDGVEMDIDMSAGKACWAEGTGNYTDCIRIAGGYNEWGDKYLAESPAGFTEIKYEITPTIYVSEPVEEEQNEFDPNGTYHAYIGIQTPTWIFRNAWDDASYGIDSGCFDQLGFIDGEWIAQGGTFTDVEITGNGTYTVKVEGYDFSGTFNDEAILGADGLFNLLFVSTDLPVNDAVVISNVVLKMDGTEIVTQDTAFLDSDSKEVQKVLLANIWNNDIEDLPYYAAPTQSIEISFDVSGFANDAVEKTVTDDPTDDVVVAEPASTDSADAEESGSSIGIIVAVIVVVVAAIGGGVVVSKKKKAK